MKIRDAHRELQWKRLRKAPWGARQSRLVVHSRPAVCQRQRKVLCVGLFGRYVSFTLLHGTLRTVAEHAGSADDLLEQAVFQLLSLDRFVLAMWFASERASPAAASQSPSSVCPSSSSSSYDAYGVT